MTRNDSTGVLPPLHFTSVSVGNLSVTWKTRPTLAFEVRTNVMCLWFDSLLYGAVEAREGTMSIIENILHLQKLTKCAVAPIGF